MELNRVLLADCLDVMKTMPDKAYDLAICDPPYGIDRGEKYGNEGNHWKQYTKKDWDAERPKLEYWEQLFRVTKNQIIWGGNYFTEFLPPSMGWIFWDKGQRIAMSDGELAFSSFERALRVYVLNRCKIPAHGGSIHPTQKPVQLYRWLLKNYAKPGDKILDTHAGSCSSVIACLEMGFEYLAIEKDADYHAAAVKRIAQYQSQHKIQFA